MSSLDEWDISTKVGVSTQALLEQATIINSFFSSLFTKEETTDYELPLTRFSEEDNVRLTDIDITRERESAADTEEIRSGVDGISSRGRRGEGRGGERRGGEGKGGEGREGGMEGGRGWGREGRDDCYTYYSDGTIYRPTMKNYIYITMTSRIT